MLVAEKLRDWDDAVNGTWPLKVEAEAVFHRADVDNSGSLELGELSQLKSSMDDTEQVRASARVPRMSKNSPHALYVTHAGTDAEQHGRGP